MSSPRRPRTTYKEKTMLNLLHLYTPPNHGSNVLRYWPVTHVHVTHSHLSTHLTHDPLLTYLLTSPLTHCLLWDGRYTDLYNWSVVSVEVELWRSVANAKNVHRYGRRDLARTHTAILCQLQITFEQQGQHCSKIMKPPQSLPLHMAERLRRAQPDSLANHVTARSISDWRALTWVVTETGWARRKRSAICSGKLISVHIIPHDVNRRYGI